MKLHIFIFALAMLCLGVNCSNVKATSPEEDRKFAEKVNLAMRQTGHHLLKLEGDSTSAIAPVEEGENNEFILKLDVAFDYDTLPFLINQALISYKIQRDYHVAIKNCTNSETVLGYNYEAFAKGEMACRGREQTASCNQIVICFEPERISFIQANGPGIAAGTIAGLLLAGLFLFIRQKKLGSPVEPSSESGKPLGNFRFDHQNQRLRLGEETFSLTFRESKLLNFFASHPNEVLTRETLGDAVWGDEGVIVGRSLDVFISRLRKILKVDDSVSIKTIHGVGYRLEVS